MKSATHSILTELITKHVHTIQSFLLFLAVALVVGTSHLLNADEGIILNGAWKIYNEQTLYVDFFEFVAPGSYYLAFLAMKLFGPTYFAVRIVAMLLLACSAFALADISKMLGATARSSHIAGTLWIIFVALSMALINHNAWSTEISIIGLALFLRLLDGAKILSYFFVTGLTVGLIPVFLQTKGVAMLAVLFGASIVLAVIKKLTLSGVIVFMTGALIPTLGIMLLWSPALLWYQLFLWPLERYHEIHTISPFPLIIAFAVFIGLYFVVWKIRRQDRTLLAIIALTQCALYFSVISQPEFFHIVPVSFSIPIFFVLWMQSRAVEKRTHAKLLPVPLMCLLYFFAIFNFVNSINTPKYLSTVDAYRSSANDTIYSYPFAPNFYFELGIQNSYPFNVIFSGLNTNDEFDKNLAVLKRERPALILRGRGLGDKFNYDWANPHDAWIDAHYRIVQTGWVEILKRNDIE